MPWVIETARWDSDNAVRANSSQSGAVPGGLQSETERRVGRRIAEVFSSSTDDVETRIACFPRYVRRAHMTRFLALYELFKKVLPVKGSIVECGVFRGFSLMTWAKLSAVLEPNNLMRKVYGFDTFSGFPSTSPADRGVVTGVSAGDLASSVEQELLELIELFDADRFLGHIPKVEIVKGDLVETMPRFLEDNPHLVVSLLFLDADLFVPTKAAIELLLPRIPRGGIVAFDELDNATWPGETVAVMDAIGIPNLRLERFEFDPYISFAQIP